MDALPLMSGGVMLMCLSNLPGRRRAGSNTSGLLVPKLESQEIRGRNWTRLGNDGFSLN